jgi:DNA polymerase (family 10)
MPVHNADIAAIFEEIADLLEIENANVFRIRAYRNAARTVAELDHDARQLVELGEDLEKLPGIGKDLAAKIAEIVQTGHCNALDKLRKSTPSGLADLLKVPGLGPKKVSALYHELDIHTTEQLMRAAKDHRISTLSGFGVKTEKRILDTLKTYAKEEHRLKLAVAAQYAESLVDYLRQCKDVKEVVVAGSYRRYKETVGDLDILVTAKHGKPVMEHLVEYEDVDDIVSQGKTRATVILRNRLQVDVRVVKQQSFGAALHYFTGSKAHNIAIRRRARKRGLKINEYGVFKKDKRIAGKTEQEVYKSVGLPWIPPELRENRGEIEAAEKKKLPKLVELDDIRGDLHAHTKATDGHNTIEQLAEAVKQKGWDYFAITEHSKRLTVAHGLDKKRLLKQIEQIDKLNEKLKGVTVLTGIEVDILEDGNLDMPDDVLEKLDLVIGAVHSKFNLSRAKQTERVMRAMNHPHFTILAHPSGRLIDQREPYDIDMSRVINQAKQRGCYLELNCHPERLDLLDIYCQMAREAGVLISINSDAHTTADFDNMRYGVGQARRGWLEAKDVLNTRTLTQLRRLLKRTM